MNKPIIIEVSMKKIARVLLAGIFFVEGMMFYNHYSYAHHVEQAQSDLNELGQILENGLSPNPLKASVLSAFSPEDGLTDMKLKYLSKRIVSSTEHAIENADDITKTSKLKTALDQIAVIQNEEVILIKSAITKVQDKSASLEIEAVHQKAVDLKDKVQLASVTVQEAIDNQQEEIEINIITSKDKDQHKETDSNVTNQEVPQSPDATIPKGNATDERIRRKKLEDEAQREANRKQIKVIEEGRDAKHNQDLQARLIKQQRQLATEG